MNWEAAGAIGEIVGALAVVITLVYLAVQLRQNAMSQRATVEQQIATGLSESFRINADTDIPRIWALAYRDFAELTEIEAAKFAFFLFSHLKQFEHAYIQHEMGNLSDVSWEAIDRTFRETVTISDGARQYWKFRRTAFHEGFCAHVDRALLKDVTENREAIIDFLTPER